MFKSIIVAFDGSADAGKALEIGARLAVQEQAPLGIIYVVDASHMELSPEIRKMGEIEHTIEPMPRMVVNLETAPVNLARTMAHTSVDA